MKAKHQPFITPELFERVQDERVKRRTNMNNRIRTEATTYSLSGIIWCRPCKSNTWQNTMKSMRQFVPEEDKVKNLDKFAHFLAHIAEAWKEGTQEQRNKMANVLFQEVWIEDNRVVVVKPREELKPLFQLSYEEHLEKSNWRPRGVDGNRHF